MPRTLAAPIALAVVVLAPLPVRADCASAAACNVSGTKNLAAGRFAQAVEDFQSQAGWAEGAEDKAAQALAFNNLVLTELKRGRAPMARAWLREALRVQPDGKAARFNQGLVDKALASRVAPKTPTGTWVSYAGGGEWNQLQVDDLGGGRLHVGLEALRMGLNWREYGPAALGTLNEVLRVSTSVATYTAEDCTMRFRFHGDEAEVTQQGGCGFGAGVDANGTYIRTDDARPKIEEP